MIHFKAIKGRNFLSIGDQPLSIQLDKSVTTIITGVNGSGKSTFIDMITYALFGKPFRKVKLGQLINSINESGLEVEITFSVGGNDYLVKRGQKPAKFEIYVNGSDNKHLLPQPATTAEYQYILENDIMKLNYKTFTQIIILGSASFKPFMQLKLADRREIIENLLDISVFSEMNSILKSKIKNTKETLIDLQHKMDMTKQKYSSKYDHLKESTEDYNIRIRDIESDIIIWKEDVRARGIHRDKCELLINETKKSISSCDNYEDVLLSINDNIIKLEKDIAINDTILVSAKNDAEIVNDVRSKIKECNDLIKNESSVVDKLNKDIDNNSRLLESYKIDKLRADRNDISRSVAVLTSGMDNKLSKISFYNDNNECPECKQKIDNVFKNDTIISLQEELENDKKDVIRYQDEIEKCDADIEQYNYIVSNGRMLEEQLIVSTSNIKQLESSITLMERDINTRDLKSESELIQLQTMIDQQKDNVNILKSEKDDVSKRHIDYIKLNDDLNKLVKDLAVVNQAINSINDRIESANVNLLTLKNTPVCSVKQEDIDGLAKDIKDIDLSIIKMKHTLHYFGIVQKLLKDDGLKTKIIRKFLPIINASVNMYLDRLGFPINFEFDENFNETICSNFRGEFSYFSFSEGEKSRIDLALLFAWRDIALKKSRSAANIIIFDEIFDGSLDITGIETFMDILGVDANGYNSLIISHKDETINSRFDRNLEFVKNGHFSKVMEK